MHFRHAPHHLRLRGFPPKHVEVEIPRARAASVDRMLAEELTVNGYLKVKAAA